MKIKDVQFDWWDAALTGMGLLLLLFFLFMGYLLG